MKKEKLLFKCESENNFEQYKITDKDFFSGKIFRLVLFDLFLLLIISVIFVISKEGIAKMLFVHTMITIIFLIFNTVISKETLKKTYEKKYRKLEGTNIINEFYNSYFKIITSNSEYSFIYDRIDSIIEKESNIYLKTDNGIFFRLQKDKMSKELIDFLKNQFEKKYKNKQKMNKKSVSQLIALLLLIINIVLLFSLNKNNPKFVNEFNYGSISILGYISIGLYIIIPIVSIVFTLFNKKLYKYYLVPLLVSIATILTYLGLLIYPVIFQNNNNIKNIDNYINMIDIEIPNNVKYSDEFPFYKNDKEFKISRAILMTLNDNDLKTISDNIYNDSNYIKYTEMKSTMRYLLPYNCSDDDYILFYNKTSDQYNDIPDKTGEYIYYVYIFNKTNKNFHIYDIKVNYIK